MDDPLVNHVSIWIFQYWIPYGYVTLIHMESIWIHMDPYGSIWIPYGMHGSIWIHMDSTWNIYFHMKTDIPCEIHAYGLHMDSTWNYVDSTWLPYGFHVDSIWIPYEIHGFRMGSKTVNMNLLACGRHHGWRPRKKLKLEIAFGA